MNMLTYNNYIPPAAHRRVGVHFEQANACLVFFCFSSVTTPFSLQLVHYFSVSTQRQIESIGHWGKGCKDGRVCIDDDDVVSLNKAGPGCCCAGLIYGM